MKLNQHFHSRIWLGIGCGCVLGMGVAAFRAQADSWDKKTILTVHQPMQVRETLLEPGKYVFKLYESTSNRHVVQIFNERQTRLIDTVMAIPKQRTDLDAAFTFWETPSGTAPALRAWFYPGDTIGQEFPYPKHLTQLAMAKPDTTLLPRSQEAPAPAPTAPEPAPAPQTSDTPAKAAEYQAAPPAEAKPVEIAQNTPPPPPPADRTPDTPSSSKTSALSDTTKPVELPKTASPYPLIGLSGILLLAMSAWLRVRRSA
jgi:hypothetical protein